MKHKLPAWPFYGLVLLLLYGLVLLLSLAGCSKSAPEIEVRLNKGASPDAGLVAELMRDKDRLFGLLKDCPVSQNSKSVECASALQARHNFMYSLPKIEAHNGFTGKL